MSETTLAERLNQIIAELHIPKSEFAESVGVTRNHIYNLTAGRHTSLSRSVAILIEKEYGYPAEWILTGVMPAADKSKVIAEKMKGLDDDALRKIEAQIDALKGSGNE
jgi:transcriptional regulator with XRE-family HTH domain